MILQGNIIKVRPSLSAQSIASCAAMGIHFSPPAEFALELVNEIGAPKLFNQQDFIGPVKVMEAMAVGQKEYAITGPTSDVNVLGVIGLTTCIGLVVREPKTRQTAVAHIDEGTDLESINLILNDFSNTKEELVVQVIGGSLGSDRFGTKVLLTLQGIPGLKIASIDLYNQDLPTSFTVDVRTGLIDPLSVPTDPGGPVTADRLSRWNAMSGGFIKLYDGRS